MIKKILSLLFTVFVFVAFTNAQTGTVKGKIADKNGEPLIGANVFVKGSTLGTITDVDGNYILSKIPEGEQTIVASFIGYSNQENTVTIKAEQTITLNYVLQEDVTTLDELIIIGYGVQKKSDKTGAVAHIKADEMNGGVITDPLQAIQGKSAGVMITKKGGDPNSGFSVKIRGASGFDSNTQPLYIIDGVQGADPTTVAPEDIESYNILKDAASTAIYGSRGSNGVIIITTKKGGKDNRQISFNVKVSADQVANKLDLLSAEELRQFSADKGLNLTDGGASTDWQDEIFRTGLTQTYNLNFSGGNDKSAYYASLTHSDWGGVMRGTEKKRDIAKVNLSHKAFDNRLTLSGTMQGTFEQNDYENYNSFNKDDIIYQAYQRNPTDPVYDANGDYYKTIRAFNYENPIAVINEIDNIRDAKRFLGNFRADLEIIEGLTGSVNVSYIRNDHVSSYFRPKGIYATADNGFGKKEYQNNQQKMIDVTGTYIKTFNTVHNINAMVGYSWQESYWEGFYAQAENPQSDFMKYNNLGSFIDITPQSIGSWAGQWTLAGFFGRAQYNYNGKYYVTASLRRDGSSKFGENNKWGWFPTASVGWDMHKEAFLERTSWIDQLKLRASYGIAGNQEIGEYRSQVVFTATGTATDPETGAQVTTFGPAWNANPNLKWETTTELNFGVDFAFINSKISGTVEVYTKMTDDLLGQYQVPVPPNLAQTTFANSGSMKNSGVELYVQYHAIDNPNFKWKTSLNVSHNKTIINDLGDFVEGEVRRDGYLSGRGLIGDLNYVTGNIEGEELGAFYLPVYVKLSDDGVFLYESQTGGITRELSAAKRQIVGSPLPDVELGWSNSLTFYNNWHLDFSFRSMIGNDVYNATRMFFDYPGLLPSLNAMPEAIDWYEKGRTSSAAIADIYVEDASFLRLDYLSLGYTFNTTNIKSIKNLKIYFASNNLFTITGYSGVDPETTMDGLAFGIDQYNVYPKTRTFTFGINATF